MREFLKGLELEKETIDTIMAEYGKQVTSLKEQLEGNNKEITAYKEKISSYENQVKDLNSEIKDLNDKIETSNKSLENLQVLTDENKNLKAEVQMTKSNVKKEFSKFVTNEVMSNVNDETDFATALETYKKENPQYFGDTVVKKVQTSPNLTGGTKENTTNDIMNDILRGARN